MVDTVRWLWGTFVQAFLDRDGAVGSLMGLGAWGLMARPWRFKAGAMFRSGIFQKKNFSSWHFILLHRHVHFVSDLYHLGVISAQEVCIR